MLRLVERYSTWYFGDLSGAPVRGIFLVDEQCIKCKLLTTIEESNVTVLLCGTDEAAACKHECHLICAGHLTEPEGPWFCGSSSCRSCGGTERSILGGLADDRAVTGAADGIVDDSSTRTVQWCPGFRNTGACSPFSGILVKCAFCSKVQHEGTFHSVYSLAFVSIQSRS